MVMMVTGAVIIGVLVRILAVHIVMIVVMIGIMLCGIQRDVGKQHVQMVLLSGHGVLDAAHGTGHGSLGEHKQQADAKHRRGAP